ncbi:MAG TPA: PP2C family protein-serine/threonine phosphatase [Tepidisphaeraceae bacterium]|nr:PP2C family protein-serine/threonine phosphatase [Tepidisphaeraceae bacterium]
MSDVVTSAQQGAHQRTSMLAGIGDAAEQLRFVVETVRELSAQDDPQGMVRYYGTRMRTLLPSDGYLSLSRRELSAPLVRVTRFSGWGEVNPWKQKDRLPVLDGGLLSRLIYAGEPVVIDDLASELAEGDPAAEFLAAYGSAVAIPLFDGGESLNMVVLMRTGAGAFVREYLPEHTWMANLFGRATQNLVLHEEVRRAYERVDRELKTVADIQRSLLPTELPRIPGLEIAADYQTSTRAGGDYYDFFRLHDGRWGILIADVSGHGTPAAVIMAVTHSIAHMMDDAPDPPSKLLGHVNRHLTDRYTMGSGTFVTALYAIYDPAARRLAWAAAGHPPIRLVRNGVAGAIDGEHRLPLGIDRDEQYVDSEYDLRVGDTLVLYTDGITEARNPRGDMFTERRMDEAAAGPNGSPGSAGACAQRILATLESFRAGRPLGDDRTLLVLKVTEGPDEGGGGI